MNGDSDTEINKGSFISGRENFNISVVHDIKVTECISI